jgi:hypothetical protein
MLESLDSICEQRGGNSCQHFSPQASASFRSEAAGRWSQMRYRLDYKSGTVACRRMQPTGIGALSHWHVAKALTQSRPESVLCSKPVTFLLAAPAPNWAGHGGEGCVYRRRKQLAQVMKPRNPDSPIAYPCHASRRLERYSLGHEVSEIAWHRAVQERVTEHGQKRIVECFGRTAFWEH